MSSPSESVKAFARGVATVIVSPMLLSYAIRSRLLGERALLGSTQLLALIPGFTGQYLRGAFLSRVLAHCAPTAVVEWGTVFSDAEARLDDHVYIGPNCHIGLAHIERESLIGPAVQIPSGPLTHGLGDPDQPIRNQHGVRQAVRIGANSWIGGSAVILADLGPSTVVGAGAVVTRPVPGYCVVAGVPARFVRARSRNQSSSGESARRSR
jgi:acetyltransferase-like isoleucine patch superfamily enzyme